MKNLLVSVCVLLLSACSSEPRKVYVPVERSLPTLNNYKPTKIYKFGNLRNKDGKVCVEKWGACLPKNEFKGLIFRIKDLENTLELHIKQIDTYNAKADKKSE